MRIIRSQNLHYTIPRSRIERTTVEKKEEGVWIVTATCDRPLVLGRYRSEKEAIVADVSMWLCEGDVYTFPPSGFAPGGRFTDADQEGCAIWIHGDNAVEMIVPPKENSDEQAP